MDARQINLTRFELFFPEKRTFFLEGAGVYDVAGLGSARTRSSSRSSAASIGLLNGQEVPILARPQGDRAGRRASTSALSTSRRATRPSTEGPLAAQNLLARRG